MPNLVLAVAVLVVVIAHRVPVVAALALVIAQLVLVLAISSWCSPSSCGWSSNLALVLAGLVHMVASFVVDQPPGALRGRRTEQAGFDQAIGEILANRAESGAKAGIADADIAILRAGVERVALLDKYIQPAEKLLELLNETRAAIDDERQRIVSAIAESVERRAKTAGPGLLAKYESTRAYRSAVALKAAKTRKKDEGGGEPTPT